MHQFAHRGRIMHFANVHVVRAQSGDFIGFAGGQASQVMREIIALAGGRCAHHAGQDLDRTAGTQTQPAQTILIAQNRRSRPIGDR